MRFKVFRNEEELLASALKSPLTTVINCTHTAISGSPLVKRGAAHDVFAAILGQGMSFSARLRGLNIWETM